MYTNPFMLQSYIFLWLIGNNCENVSYKLTYADGRDVLEGDSVNYGTYMDMRLVISYEGTGVNIEDFDFIMLYEQA